MERTGGVALWLQVAERLKADIASGTWPQGDRLPTEARLAERFGVNRHTIRRALSDLAKNGLVSTKQGRGTVVEATPLSYPISTRTRFSEIISQQARSPGGRLIASTREQASPLICEKLKMTSGAPVHRIETLHVADGTPVSMSTSWFSAKRFPDLVTHYAESGSFTKALKTSGLADYKRKHTEVSARIADSNEQHWLNLPNHTPVLVTAVVNTDMEETPVQFSMTRFVADRIRLTIEF